MNTKELKPFDLQAALNGEPVMLRNGQKAFVRHHETEQPTGPYLQLWGAGCRKDGSAWVLAWSKDGLYDIDGCASDLDIIGMCQAKPTRIINGFEVPAPETGELNERVAYYTPVFNNNCFYREEKWAAGSVFDLRLLKRGLVFLTKEDAIATAKAMLGIDPYEEAEE